MNLRLGVNIDHVATLRNARGVNYPSPLEAAKIVKKAGANQITIHLREDTRHINEKDSFNIIKKIKMDINLEIAPIDRMIKFAIKNKPNYVCLVPEKRKEITTEGGINLDNINVIKSINKLKKNNIKTCLFIDPNIQNIKKCNKLGVKYIEIHTGSYANKISKKNKKLELNKIIKCAKLAKKFAAKEAFTKAFGTGISNGVYFKDIEIYNNEYGKPLIKLYGNVKEKYNLIEKNKNDLSLNLSITDEKYLVHAFVIISN